MQRNNDVANVLPNLTDDQKDYLEKLKAQTGVTTVISRLEIPSGSDDLIIVLPSATQLNGYADDDGQLFFPNWDDLDVVVVTDTMLTPKDYQVFGYRVSSLERSFLGNKIAIKMAVKF